MKKFLMTLVAAFGLAVSANAQTYVGGGFSIFGQDNGNTTVTTYKFIPEIGYNFNKDWAAGVLSVGKVPIKAMKRALK